MQNRREPGSRELWPQLPCVGPGGLFLYVCASQSYLTLIFSMPLGSDAMQKMFQLNSGKDLRLISNFFSSDYIITKCFMFTFCACYYWGIYMNGEFCFRLKNFGNTHRKYSANAIECLVVFYIKLVLKLFHIYTYIVHTHECERGWPLFR